jgi:hypothetical protein
MEGGRRSTRTQGEATMKSGRAKSGGGFNLNKVKHSAGGKAEPRSRAVNVHAVHDLGAKKGNHVTGSGDTINVRKEELYKGSGYCPPVGPTEMKGVGPGAGRTIHRAGSQSATPAVKPLPKKEWL